MSARAFAELTAAFTESATSALDTVHDRGRVVVASWPSVPVEVIRAAGHTPLIVRGSSSPTPLADPHLEADVFPSRVRQLANLALGGQLADVAAVVIPRTSDADYKLFLYLREFSRLGTTRLAPTWLYDLLQSHTPQAASYDRARTAALVDQLTGSVNVNANVNVGEVLRTSRQSGGLKASPTGTPAGGLKASPTDGSPTDVRDLMHHIVLANAAREAARGLDALRRGHPRISGTVALPLLGAFWRLHPTRYAELADEAAREDLTRAPLTGPRVLLAGAPADDTGLHAAIEAHGLVVVAETSPWGSGVARTDVRVDADPLQALADFYRTGIAGTRIPAADHRRWLDTLLIDVDAVIFSLPPDDAVWGWEYPELRDVLNARGVPHACVYGDPHAPLPAGDRAAIAALVTQAAQSPRCEVPRG